MSAFFAYPETTGVLADAIGTAVELANDEKFPLYAWQGMKIIGFKVDDVVRSEIQKADVLAADITYPNPNVFYEIGYAIGLGKPFIPTLNTAIEGAVKRVQRTGIFDTIGWATYNNGAELFDKLKNWSDVAWTNKYTRKRDHGQPLFILDTLVKTDLRNQIFHAVDNSQVNFRSFDPAQTPRLTATQSIADVSSSAGVIVTLLSSDVVDSTENNLRASFVLGLSHGFKVEATAIQFGGGPTPLDFRDFVKNTNQRRETETHVEEFARAVLIANQAATPREDRLSAGLIQEIDLGSPAAENETQNLSYYFVRTAEYSRALRAEGALVIGRKGSGKTAISYQIADALSKDKRNIVIELRPSSHNLSEMREEILSVVSAGIFDHTIAAFWQYIIYVEILLKIREKVLPLSKNDFKLQDRIRDIEEKFDINERMVSGDFTSRLETAIRKVINGIQRTNNPADVRKKITNLLFEEPIPLLRDAISSFEDYFDEAIILIDDLDKGWPPRQVEPHDVRTIRHLIEVLTRIQRDMNRKDIKIRHSLYLRSDIYENLVEETSDRGKYNPIKVDWSDPEQLRYMLKQRVTTSVDETKGEMAWSALNPSIGLVDAVSLMIENSLRRPRFLIDLAERTLSVAVNRGHTAVTSHDLEEGLRQMSLYLVSDFGYEMRDIAGTPEDIFYAFIGKSSLLTYGELDAIIGPVQANLSTDKVVDLLLWYGFLGVVGDGDQPIFIYDRAYDFRRVEAERNVGGQETLYAVNEAFLRGLRR